MIIIYTVSLLFCLMFVYQISIDDINQALNILFIENPEYKDMNMDGIKVYKLFLILSFIPIVNTLFTILIIYIKYYNYKL